jgi:hypothetical protein
MALSSAVRKNIQKQIDAAKKAVEGLQGQVAARNQRNKPPAARGDDFADGVAGYGDAEAAYSQGADKKPRGNKDQLRNRSFGLAGGSTVLSNANKIQKVVPLLDSQANNLSFNLSDSGGANFTGGDDSGDSFGDDEGESFDEMLGFADKKKKKKKGEEPLLDPIAQQQMALLESMQKNADAQAKSALHSIRNKFNLRQAEQQRANESGMASVKQALNLGGSSRYAPISSQGIVSAAETAGIRALTALDAEEQQLIGEVKSAQQANDYRLLESKLGLLDSVRQGKAKAVADLQAAQQETEQQVENDNFIAEAFSTEGLTDPVSIFNYIKAQGGNVPLAEITSALKGMNELSGGIGGTGFKLENKGIGLLLGNGFTAPDIKALQADLSAGASIDDVLAGVSDPDMQNALKEAFGLKPETNMNVKPGVGATTSTDEAFIRTRLFAKIAPILNKGALSDDDRAIIDGRIAEFRDAGFGEQEILDTLAGLPPEVNTPYNSTFRDLIVSNSDTIEKQNQNIGRLSQQLTKGNYQQAMNTVENMAFTEARKIDPDNYMGTGAAQFALKQAKELRKVLDNAEDVVGPFDGTVEELKGKLLKLKDPRAAEISAKITKLTAPMRNQLAGTAVTDSETTFLEPLIPELRDTMANFRIKVNELESQSLDRYNSTRSIVSLPTVTTEMVIDPKKRLQVYSNDIYLPASGQLDI